MWEIFSFGEPPYPGQSWNTEFVDTLKSGSRLLRPENCPEEMYNFNELILFDECNETKNYL